MVSLSKKYGVEQYQVLGPRVIDLSRLKIWKKVSGYCIIIICLFILLLRLAFYFILFLLLAG